MLTRRRKHARLLTHVAFARAQQGAFIMPNMGRQIQLPDNPTISDLNRMIRNKRLGNSGGGVRMKSNKGNKKETFESAKAKHEKKVTQANNQLNEELSSATDFAAKLMVDTISEIATKVLTSASVANSKQTVKMVNNMETRKIHKTIFETGERTSRRILTAAKANGTVFKVLYDTKMDATDPNERALLTWGAGFNSKHIFFPPENMQVCKALISGVLVNGESTSADEDTTRYDARTKVLASIMKVKNQFMLHNNSAYLPAVIKVVFFKFDGDLPSETILQKHVSSFTPDGEKMAAINAQVKQGEVVTEQPFGMVPWFYVHRQMEWLEIENPRGVYASGDFSLKGRGLLDSTKFRQSFKIIETFEKTIEPGDYWNINHIHNCGNGLDEKLFNRNLFTASGDRDTRSDPFTYGVYFETKGKMVEAIVCGEGANFTQSTYQGTSPTYISMENRSSIYYVKEQNMSRDNVNPTEILQLDEAVHRTRYLTDQKAFTTLKSPGSIRGKEIFTLPVDITSEPTSGKTYIPVVSSGIITTDKKPHNAS